MEPCRGCQHSEPVRTIVGWRVWYDGDQRFDSRQHTWQQLPEDGFLIAALYYNDGYKRILEGADYYFTASHPEGTIYGTSMVPPDPHRYTDLSVKLGKWVPDSVMQHTEDEAFASTWS